MEIVAERGEGDENPEILSVIEVQRPLFNKPFLGGFKNTKDNQIYHHAYAQTDQIKRSHNQKYERETQTYDQSTKSTKVKREGSTQMQSREIYIDCRKDRVIQAKNYFSSEMWLERREEAALFIQRLVRGMLARNKTSQLRGQKLKML